MPKTAIIRKYDAGGAEVSKETLVKYKGVYIKPSQVPKRVRGRIRQSFFADAIAGMTDREASKVQEFLRNLR